MALGSVFHQSNESGDATAVDIITPIPGTSAKIGVSYQGDEGLTVGFFDTYMSPVTGYPVNTLNPPQGSSHMLGAQLRFDVSKYFHRTNATG